MSGVGVMIAALITIKRTANLLVFVRLFDLTRPAFPSAKSTMGTSKVNPKAKIMAEQKVTNRCIDIIAMILLSFP